MVRKYYGKHIINYKWCSNWNIGIIDRCLEIYEINNAKKAVLWDCSKKGWREEPNKPIILIKFSDRGDMNECLTKIKAKFCVHSDAAVEKCPAHDYGTIKNK